MDKGAIVDHLFIKVFPKAKKDLVPCVHPVCAGLDIWSSFKFSNVKKFEKERFYKDVRSTGTRNRKFDDA